ncbi:hypothetical protein ABPG74_017924 [Tetrahymena malaccensis]
MTYSQEIAYVQEYFEKTYIITDNLLYQAQKLWKNVDIQNKKKQAVEQLNKLFQNIQSRNQIIQNYEFIFQLNVNNKTLSEEISSQVNPIITENKDEDQTAQNNNQLNNLLFTQNCIADQKNLRDSIQTVPTQQSILLNNNDTHLQINKQSFKIQEQPKKDQKISKQYKQQSQSLLKLKYLIEQEKYLQNKNPSEQSINKQDMKFFKEKGLINMLSIVGLIIQSEIKLPEKKRILTKQLIKKLLENQSRFQTIIQGFMIEFLIECLPICQQILHLLKMESIKFYNEKDWYRAYIFFGQYAKDKDQFPIYKLNEESIKLAFQQFAQQMETFQTYKKDKQTINQTPYDISATAHSVSEIKYLECLVLYLPLIEQYLFTQALGISIQKQKIYEISKGDCFHCKSFKIRSIKSYETRKFCTCCIDAEKFLNLNDVEKGLSDYQKLPEWIKIDFQKQFIRIKGTPNETNIGQQRIKIYDQKGYLLRQFDIKVLPERKEKQHQLEKSKEDNKQTLKILSPYRKKSFKNKGFLLSQSLFKNNLFKKQKSYQDISQLNEDTPNKIYFQTFKSNYRNNKNICSINCLTQE